MVTSSASLISMTLGAVTSKIIAVLAGPTGISTFSQIRQLGQLLAILATLNGQNSLIRGMASKNKNEAERYAWTIFLTFLLGAIVACALFLSFAPHLNRYLFKSDDKLVHLSIYYIPAIVLLGVLASYYQGALNGFRMVRSLAVAQISAAVASAFAAYPCVRLGGALGFVVLVATGFIFYIISSAVSLKRIGWSAGGLLPPIIKSTNLDKIVLQEHIPFALVTLITGVSGSVMVISIRTLYVHEGGLALGGIFDAAWSISMMYVMLLLSSFGVHYLPKLSGADTKDEIQLSVESVFRVTALLATPLVCTAILFKPWAINLLYSVEFLDAVKIMRWTTLGDYIKITSWVFGMLLIARAERMRFAVTELLWQISMLAIIGFLLRSTKEAVGIAYLITNVVYLTYVWIYANRNYGVVIKKKIMIIWLKGLFLVSVLATVTWAELSSPTFFSFGIYLVAMIYIIYSFTDKRQLLNLLLLCRNVNIFKKK